MTPEDEDFLRWWYTLTPAARLEHARRETIALTHDAIVYAAALRFADSLRYSAAALAWAPVWVACRASKDYRRACLCAGAWLEGRRL